MKDMRDLLQKFDQNPRVVEYQTVHLGFKKLEVPVMSDEINCPLCGDAFHTTFRMQPEKGAPIGRFCHNPICKAVVDKIPYPCGNTPTIQKRAILWAVWCEINDIGDVHHDVSFEKIDQDPKTISFLANFSGNPKGIVFMQGGAGTGKTYASMGTCELFTRNSQAARFMTEKQMHEKWMETFKSETLGNFVSQLKSCALLVIDDFGTSEPNEKYMSFLMDIINYRMQWTNKGTIITTNLNNEKFYAFCGDALTDRIKTGQKIIFKHNSRRTKC